VRSFFALSFAEEAVIERREEEGAAQIGYHTVQLHRHDS